MHFGCMPKYADNGECEGRRSRIILLLLFFSCAITHIQERCAWFCKTGQRIKLKMSNGNSFLSWAGTRFPFPAFQLKGFCGNERCQIMRKLNILWRCSLIGQEQCCVEPTWKCGTLIFSFLYICFVKLGWFYRFLVNVGTIPHFHTMPFYFLYVFIAEALF